MTTTFRLKLLTCCVGAVFTQTVAVTASADSAVGVDTMLGNALNPTTINQLKPLDPEGIDIALHSRTPTGQLYDWDPLPQAQRTSSSGWVYSGSMELGGLVVSGDEDSGWFRKYKDLDTGLYLNNFEFKAHQPGSALYVEGVGGGVAYDDQFYGLKFGRYNDWRGQLFYNETPHVFTSTYRSLWKDVDDSYLKLRNLTPGGTTNAATTGTNLVDELEATDFTELGLIRRKGGLRFDKRLTDTWQLLGSYSKEERRGARPFGAVFAGNPGGPSVEIPEAIDYDTHDLMTALRYDDGLNNLNLTATASLFRNNISTLTVENPTFATVPGTTPLAPFTAATFDLYPDNDYWNVKGEYARSLPDFYRGRFTAVASFSRMSQDDKLIAPTRFDIPNWNTTDALSQKSADAQIDSMLFDVGLSLKPIDKLDVKGKIRYYETENSTEYWACNPLTGQWGRLINDGAGTSVVTTPEYLDPDVRCNIAAVRDLGIVPNSGAIPIRNTPYDYSQLNYVLGGDYQLTPGSSISATLEREEYRRDHRERDKTWENIVKLGYVNRGFTFGTVRLSAEYGERRGDRYNVIGLTESVSASMGPDPTTGNVNNWVHSGNDLRKFDISDRNELVLNGRLNLIAAEALDVGLGLQYKNSEYPDSPMGRTDDRRLMSANLDVNYQPTHRLGLYGFYAYQEGILKQAGRPGGACVIGSTYYFFSNGVVNTTGVAPAGTTLLATVPVSADNWSNVCANGDYNPRWPIGNEWRNESKDRNHVVGVGGRYDFGWARLQLDYAYSTGETEISYRYNINTTGAAFTPQQVALIGNGMPDLEASQHFLDLSLLVPISKTVALRALYRYEQGTIKDWHYNGVYANPTSTANPLAPGNNANLDSGTYDYHNNVVGLFVNVSF